MTEQVTDAPPQVTPNAATEAPQEPTNVVAGTDVPNGDNVPAEAPQKAADAAPVPSADELKAMQDELAKYREAEEARRKEEEERIEAAKSAEEKAADAARKMEEERAALQRENAILRYSNKHGFTEEDTNILFGDDEDARMQTIGDWRRDAIAFREAMKAEGEKIDKSAPRLLPRVDLKPGASPQPVTQPPSGDRGYPASWVKKPRD